MNNLNPRVTVRMSAYNHEPYVEQAILSIVNQTYQDFELLVIDDGSRDCTPDILEKLSMKYGFYFERQENRGLPSTLNKLIGMAQGEYITGCASDDFWPLDRLENQVAFLDNFPEFDLVHGLWKIVDSDGKISSSQPTGREPARGEKQLLRLISRKAFWNVGTTIYRKTVYSSVGRYNESIPVEDFNWMYRAAKILKIGFLNTNVLFYRKHESNWTKSSEGLKKIYRSSWMTAAELGMRDGLIFLYFKGPIFFAHEITARRYQRFCFLFLFPLYIINRFYLRQAIRCLSLDRF